MATKEGICLSGCSCSGKLGIKLGFLGYQCGMLWYADRDNLETTEESIGTIDNSLRWPKQIDSKSRAFPLLLLLKMAACTATPFWASHFQVKAVMMLALEKPRPA